MRKVKTKEIEICEKVFAHEIKLNNKDKGRKIKALEEKDMHQVSSVMDALGTDLVIMLERKCSAWAECKAYAWIAGASTKLTKSKALILCSLLNSMLICVLSKIIAIIFDNGASTSSTPFLSDLKGKITPCFVRLQGISSGLNLRMKYERNTSESRLAV